MLALAYSGYASFLVNAENRADPREFLVTTQSSEEVARVARQVVAEARAAKAAGRDYTITVDSAEGATYPWAWYFRDVGAGYVDLSAPGTPLPESDALILTTASRDRLQAELGSMVGREFPFRVWWVREYGDMSPANWWRWFTKREPWNETGGMPEWLYVRRE